MSVPDMSGAGASYPNPVGHGRECDERLATVGLLIAKQLAPACVVLGLAGASLYT